MNQYHPKLLKIFTYEQLELLSEHSHCYVDKDELIHILYSNMDFGHYEIYCDCEAKQLDNAVIYVQFNTTWEGENIGIEDFWELFMKSNPKECKCICINF